MVQDFGVLRDLRRGEFRAGVELGGLEVVAIDLAREDPVDEVLAGPDERLGLVAGRLAAGSPPASPPSLPASPSLAASVLITLRSTGFGVKRVAPGESAGFRSAIA